MAVSGYRRSTGRRLELPGTSPQRIGKAARLPLGYGEKDLETELSFGDDEDNKHPVAYFRRTFEVEEPNAWPEYALLLRYDDGAAVFVNGEEVARKNLEEGDLDEKSWAAGKTRSEFNYHYIRIPSRLVKKGKNLLAISMHQADADSSDTILDAELIADRGKESIDDDPDGIDGLKKREGKLRSILGDLEKATISVEGGGSGVIISEDGLILSAAHVVDVFRKKEVTIFFQDGKKAKAEVLGGDRARDSGMFKLKDSGPWPHVEIRETRLKKGEWVMALGHPQGFHANRGSPLRLGKVLQTNDSRQPFIMTGCTVTGGDSGGPLFDMDGKVVGIHSFVSQNLLHNFHVPMQGFRRFWDRLKSGDKWGRLGTMHEFGDERDTGRQRAILGVRPSTDSVEGGGVALRGTVEDSGAEKAGLRKDDIIKSIDDIVISKRDDLTEYLLEKSPGDEVSVKFLRGEEEMEVSFALGSRPLERSESRSGARRESMLHEDVLGAYEDAVKPVSASTVRIFAEGNEIILGTIVSEDGYLVTKASAIKGESDFKCHLPNGDRVDAEIVSLNRTHDLGLMKVEAEGLTPVEWASEAPAKGTFVAAATPDTLPIRVGVVSAAQRDIARDYGFLGVILAEKRDGGVVISNVMERGAARRAGIQSGDTILSFDGKTSENVQEFQNLLKETEPGQKVVLQLKRAENEMSIRVTLGSRDAGMPTSPNQVGGRFSTRRVGYRSALQTDLTLTPEQCGGPLVDLEGRVVGLNIARSSRIRSFALPGASLRELLITNDDGEPALKPDPNGNEETEIEQPKEEEEELAEDTKQNAEESLAEKIKAAEEQVEHAQELLQKAEDALRKLKEQQESQSE